MSSIDQAIHILKQGGIVIFPTDTAYGIGCRIDNRQGVERLFRIRRRPKDQATPVLVNSVAMAQQYYRSPIPDNVRHLLETYWPGALTVVFYCQTEKTTPLARGNGATIGLRMPDHEITLQLITGVGVPILGPSANFHGYSTPFLYTDLDQDLVRLVDYVVKGECKAGNVSTVVDCTQTPFAILRKGAIDIELFQETCK